MFCGGSENYPGQAKAEFKQKTGKVEQQKIRLRVNDLKQFRLCTFLNIPSLLDKVHSEKNTIV